MSFFNFLMVWVLPSLFTWWLANFLWRRLENKKKESHRIKSLISTEEQGEFVNISFLMENDSVRSFRVLWLKALNCPNEVVDLENWNKTYDSPFYEAARHAAYLHHKGGGRINKNVYDSEQDWRLM